MNSGKRLTESARIRTGIMAALHTRSPLTRKDFSALGPGHRIDQMLYSLRHNGMIKAHGKPGSMQYALTAKAPKPNGGAITPATALRSQSVDDPSASQLPTVGVDWVRSTGRLRLTINGPLILELGSD